MYIFDARNSTSVLVTLGALTVLVFIFWGHGEIFASMNKQKSVTEQLKIWESTLPKSYSYKIISGCMSVTNVEASVLNGVHYFAHNENLGERDKTKLIDLFNVVEQARAQAYKLETQFHDKYGFPTSIIVDWQSNTVDDECFYEVSEFEVIEP
ncbi:DUF6174 domain-containing protein [Pseudoalteromonas spongiae]|uniref:DUF6174 domain-containing protein n=1 Tax=Pseudoalteromonas spongiae TaxID=298657 RepID=UPI0037360339